MFYTWVMSKTECKRCGNEGMHGYKHVAAGMCFACGRTPAGGASSKAAPLCSLRERIILDISSWLRNAERAKSEGTLASWWADVGPDSDEYGCRVPGIASRVRSAPADVQARAIAAFARVGIAIRAE